MLCYLNPLANLQARVPIPFCVHISVCLPIPLAPIPCPNPIADVMFRCSLSGHICKFPTPCPNLFP